MSTSTSMTSSILSTINIHVVTIIGMRIISIVSTVSMNTIIMMFA